MRICFNILPYIYWIINLIVGPCFPHWNNVSFGALFPTIYVIASNYHIAILFSLIHHPQPNFNYSLYEPQHNKKRKFAWNQRKRWRISGAARRYFRPKFSGSYRESHNSVAYFHKQQPANVMKIYCRRQRQVAYFRKTNLLPMFLRPQEKSSTNKLEANRTGLHLRLIPWSYVISPTLNSLPCRWWERRQISHYK